MRAWSVARAFRAATAAKHRTHRLPKISCSSRTRSSSTSSSTRSSSSSSSRALVLNAGSSSLKYGLFDVAGTQAAGVCSGLVERIGLEDPAISHTAQDRTRREVAPDVTDHGAALREIIARLALSPGDIDVVGHRVVHGGQAFSAPALITPEVECAIADFIPLAPLHNPANLLGIQRAREAFPDSAHVAVFDTAFHATMGADAYTYALPAHLLADHGVRRYGFHGSSYRYVLDATAAHLGRPAGAVNAIILHLGNGASMAAIRAGACVDTTMGMTPLEGLVMGTRSGDVDPGVLTFLQAELGMSATEVDATLNRRSGLLGLCGESDMRAVCARAEGGDPDALLARRVAVARIRKHLGAFFVRLGGAVDAVVFTGGIGENDAALREAVCADLGGLGVAVDTAKNAAGMTEVQAAFSAVKVMVVPTNEEVSIALQAARTAGVLGEAPQTPRRRRRRYRARAAPPPPEEEEEAEAAAPRVAPIGNRLFVDGNAPTALVEAALLSSLLPHTANLGYFRLLTHGAEDADPKLAYLRETPKFHLDEDPAHSMYGMTVEEAVHLHATGEGDAVAGRIVERFNAYASDKDFVLVSGPQVGARGAAAMPGGSTFYARLCSALHMPALFVLDVDPFHQAYSIGDDGAPRTGGDDAIAREGSRAMSEDALENELAAVKRLYEVENAVRLAGVVVQGLGGGAAQLAAVRGGLAKVGVAEAASLPADDRLSKVSMAEVAAGLGASVLWGREALGAQLVDNVEVASAQVPHLLSIIAERPGSLVITHAHRQDVILALIAASESVTFPLVPGVLLTGAAALPAEFTRLLDGMDVRMPILLTPETSHEAALRVDRLRHEPLPSAQAWSACHKLETAEGLFEAHTDAAFHRALVAGATPGGGDPAEVEDISPLVFTHMAFSAARADPQRIVLPEGNDPRVVAAAGQLLARGLCEVTLLGEPAAVRALAAEAHVSLEGAEIVDPHAVLERAPEPWAEELVAGLYEARKAKGMESPAAARELLLADVSYFGTMMMKCGRADGMVSGACHSTANTMRPALQLIKTAPGSNIVSSVFFMLLRDRVYVYGDCAINVDPDAEQLAEIAAASAGTARAFGVEPRVALLSYATGDSNTGPQIDKVREATRLARERAPGETIEGPIQFDAAVDPAIAAVKYPTGAPELAVAGRATVCVFPDLNTGNNTYKAVQQASKTSAVGPIMQGLRMPVNDLSRGCTVEDVVNTVVCTALQSIAAKE